MGSANLPAVVTEGALPEGDTAIHRHPAAQQAWELCKLLRLDHAQTVSSIRSALLDEWPDLDISTSSLDHFLEAYVEPYVTPTPGFYRRGLLRAGVKLNAVAEIAKLADMAQGQLEEAKGRINKVLERDDEGKPTVVGPSDKDFQGMVKNAIEMRRMQLDEMARIGMAPERKGGGQGGVTVVAPVVNHINLRDAVGGLDRPVPVDAKFTTGGTPDAPGPKSPGP